MAERIVTIRISADDSTAIAKLQEMGFQAQETANKITDSFGAKFKAKLDAAFKALPNIDIKADSSQVDVKVAEIKAELDALRTKKIGIDLSDTEAIAKIDELRLKLVRLGAESPSVRVRVDAAAAIAQLDLLKSVANGASGSTGGGGLSGLSSSASSLPTALSASSVGIAALVLAAIPLAGVATAGAIGLTGMAVAAGAAAGAFGLAALPVFKQVSTAITQIDADQKAISRSTSLSSYATNVQKLNLDLKNLNPTVATLVQGVLNVKQAFLNWDAQFNPAIIGVFNALLADVQPLLNDITPLVYSGASAFKSMAQQIGLVASQPDFKSFMSFLAAQAGPAFNTIASVVEQFGQAFADILQKSGPLIRDVENGLISIAAAALKWVDGGGFQSFLNWVQKNGPGIVKDVEDVAKALVKTVVALTPIGERILTVVDGFAKLISSPVFQWILNVATNFNALTIAFDVVKAAIAAATVAFDNLANFFTGTMPHAISVTSGAFTTGFQAIHNIVNTVWHAIDNDVLHPLTAFFTATITPILSTFRSTWNTVWNAVSAVIKVNWAIILGILTVIEYTFAISLGAAVLVFKTIWTAVWGAIGSTVIAVWNAMNNQVFTPIINFFTNTIPAAANTVWHAIDAAWHGVLSVTESVWNAISGALAAAWSFITGIVSAGINAVSAVISSVLSVMAGIWSSVWGGIQVVISVASGVISSVAGGISGSFGGIESAVGFLQGVWNGAWSGISSAVSWAGSVISSVVSGIESAIDSAIGAVNHLISAYNSIPVLPNIPNIPNPSTGPGQSGPAGPPGSTAHATGGIFTRPHLGLVAEAGPEAILPLNDPKRTLDILGQVLGGNGAAAANPASGGSNGPALQVNGDININDGTDAKQLANQVAFAVASKRF